MLSKVQNNIYLMSVKVDTTKGRKSHVIRGAERYRGWQTFVLLPMKFDGQVQQREKVVVIE